MKDSLFLRLDRNIIKLVQQLTIMFKSIIFWSEFPKRVNWKKANTLLEKENLNIKVYLTCKTVKEFNSYKNKIKSKKITLGAWPILKKEDGYWFSSFTSKKNIKTLETFKNLNIKIDLEPPLPKWRYNNFLMIFYLIKLFFIKGKNKHLLQKTIRKLSNTKKELIINEFPLWKSLLNRNSLHYESDKVTNNIMCYTTIAGKLLRPLIKFYLKIYLKNSNAQIYSIGLLTQGILKDEKTYNNIKEFNQDLRMIEKTKVKQIAIYSLEGLLERKDPKEWLRTIKDYIN